MGREQRVMNLIRYCDKCQLRLGEREEAVIIAELMYHEKCAPKGRLIKPFPKEWAEQQGGC
jgi:hypothetical protein